MKLLCVSCTISRTDSYYLLRHYDKFYAIRIPFTRMCTYGYGQGTQRIYAVYGLRISGKTCEAPRPDLVAAFIFPLPLPHVIDKMD